MAVAVIVDIPSGNQQVYEQFTGKLLQNGKLPEGRQIHPPQEHFEAFAREKLFPAVQQAENVTPQLMFFPVCKLIRASSRT